MSIFLCSVIALVLFSSWTTYKILKRLKSKAGCIFIGYVFGVIFCVTLFVFSILYWLIVYVGTHTDAMINGDRYTGTITAFEEEHGIDDEGYSYTNNFPVIEFTTNDGHTITRKSSEPIAAHKLPAIGSDHTVYYHAGKDRMVTIGAMTYIAIVGMLFMATVLLFAFTCIIKFALGHNMNNFIEIVEYFGVVIFIPVVMVAFDALLIYSLIYGNTEEPWVKAVMIFFISSLTLGFLGYMNLLRQKDKLKFRQTAPGHWEGYVDEE